VGTSASLRRSFVGGDAIFHFGLFGISKWNLLN
jgi:hypothetical protein